MTQSAGNVMVAGSGAIFHAPTGTTLPTSATTALNAALKEVGYVGDEGVIEAQGTETAKIKAWQNGDTVRTKQTGHDLTYKFTMIETNDETVGLFYGNGTRVSHAVKGTELPHEAYVVDVLDGDDTVRIVIPDGQVTERGEVVYKSDSAIAYPVTITCYPDATGVKAYKYVDGGVS